MKSIWQTAVLVLPVLLTACASSGPYREARKEFKENQESAYYQHEVRPREAAPTVKVEHESFMQDVQTTLLEARERWERRLSTAGEGRDVTGLAPARLAEVQALAASPDLDDRLAEALDLELLLGLVHELNPGVKAARSNLQATLQQYPQAAYLETILRQYNAFTRQLDTKVGPQQHKQMAAMQFPFPDTLTLKGEIVNLEVELAERQAEIALRDALTAMRETYYELLFVQDAIRINRESQQLLQQMIEVVQSRIRGGTATSSKVIMAQVELTRLQNDIITLEEQRETLTARINTLLSRPANARLGEPTPVEDVNLVADLETLYQRVEEGRQEIQLQRLRISRMETMVQMARRMANPDVSLGYSYFEQGMRPDGGSEMPAFATQRELDSRQAVDFGRQDAYIHELVVQIEAMKQRLKALLDQSRFLVKQEHFGLATARRSIALYQRSLLPQAEQSLEAANASYRTGEADFMSFLDAERSLLRFRLEEQRAWRNLRISQAKLDQLTGGTLPREPFQLPTREADDQTEER